MELEAQAGSVVDSNTANAAEAATAPTGFLSRGDETLIQAFDALLLSGR